MDADRAPRARDGGGDRRDLLARRDPRARARRRPVVDRRSRRPDARADRGVAAITRGSRWSPRSAKLVEREWLVEVTRVDDRRASASCAFAYPNLWTLVYKRDRRGTPPPLPRASSRAGSSCTPRAAARSAQEEVARHLALAGEPREAAIRYRRAADAARAAFANERAIRLYDRALACIGDARRRDRASTCGTTSARSTS